MVNLAPSHSTVFQSSRPERGLLIQSLPVQGTIPWCRTHSKFVLQRTKSGAGVRGWAHPQMDDEKVQDWTLMEKREKVSLSKLASQSFRVANVNYIKRPSPTSSPVSTGDIVPTQAGVNPTGAERSSCYTRAALCPLSACCDCRCILVGQSGLGLCQYPGATPSSGKVQTSDPDLTGTSQSDPSL